MKFDNMVKVYSIWIVANMESNSVNHIHFVQDTLYGAVPDAQYAVRCEVR